MYIIAAFVITFTALAGMASVAYLDLIIGLLVTTIALLRSHSCSIGSAVGAGYTKSYRPTTLLFSAP